MVDWHAWHAGYDDPASSLSRRLDVVRQQITSVLDARPGAATQLVSICAGDGRDVLPVLAVGHRNVHAVLVELDPDLAAAARATATELRLERVEVRVADAGMVEAFADVLPADVFLACGVFGNITDDDVERTVATLPQIVAPDGVVIWTRGRRVPSAPTSSGEDPAERVRSMFEDAGFVEEAFIRPTDAGFRVGVHRNGSRPTSPILATRLFTFVR